MHPGSTYGWRGRLGLIVPPTNTVNESEWARMMPRGVSFHTQRMALHEHGAGAARLMEDLGAAMAMLTPTGCDPIAYACTAGSMTDPPEALPEAMAARSGVAAVTTSAAIVAALRALGACRISVATPYAHALNTQEARFLSSNGFEVLGIRGLGIGAGGPAEYVQIARTPVEAVRAHALSAFVPGSDALLVACTDLPTLPILAGLEEALGVPVVTSNGATLWASLRAAGLDDRLEGVGRLLSGPARAERRA